MSIIIKGLDMPSSCYMCWVNHYCEAIINPPIARANGRGEHCPLVEIPKGHGRLIDKDELLDFYINHAWDWSSVDGITTTTALKQMIADLNNTPTILEAEEE